MDLSVINEKLHRAKEIAYEKGYFFPEAKLVVEEGALSATVSGLTINDRYAWDRRKAAYVSGATETDEALEELLLKASELPDMAEERRKTLARKAAQLAEEMKEIGVDVNFVNPILEAAQKLSANALELHVVAAE